MMNYSDIRVFQVTFATRDLRNNTINSYMIRKLGKGARIIYCSCVSMKMQRTI